MNDDHIIEQIYRNLDGELNEAESAELRQYLNEHPEAALIEKQWKTVQDQFFASKNHPTEPDLKAEIMKQINQEKYGSQSGPSDLRIVRNFWQRPAFRLAVAFAAGICLGLFIFSLFKADYKSTLFDYKEMKGTMTSAPAPADWTTSDVLNFQGWQVKAMIRPRYTESVVEIYLDLSSGDNIETTIDYNPDDFELMAVVPQITDANTTFSTATNQVRIISTGDNKIGVKLTNKNKIRHEIALKINQRGNQLYQNTITINKQ